MQSVSAKQEVTLYKKNTQTNQNQPLRRGHSVLLPPSPPRSGLCPAWTGLFFWIVAPPDNNSATAPQNQNTNQRGICRAAPGPSLRGVLGLDRLFWRLRHPRQEKPLRGRRDSTAADLRTGDACDTSFLHRPRCRPASGRSGITVPGH